MSKIINFFPSLKFARQTVLFIFIFWFGWGTVFAKEIFAENQKQRVYTLPQPGALQTNVLQFHPKGSLFFSTFIKIKKGWVSPITGIEGDLYRWGALRFDYFVSRNVFLQVKGVARDVLRNENSLHDVGDFTVSTVALLSSQRKGLPAFGLQIETKLPNTNQSKGLGPNTIDVSLSLLTSRKFRNLLIFGELGVGILSAPFKINVQNDVLLYGAGFLYRINNRWILSAEMNGFYSTARHTPVGTESRGRIQLGCARNFSGFAVELFPSYALNRREGTFGIGAGASWQISAF